MINRGSMSYNNTNNQIFIGGHFVKVTGKKNCSKITYLNGVLPPLYKANYIISGFQQHVDTSPYRVKGGVLKEA